MIGHLRGILCLKQPPRLVIEVGGVGYELEASLTTFAELPATEGRWFPLGFREGVRPQDDQTLVAFRIERPAAAPAGQAGRPRAAPASQYAR